MGASLCWTVEVGATEVSWDGGMGDRRFAGKSGCGRRKTWGGKAKVGSFYVRSILQWECDPKEPTSTGVGLNWPDLIGDLRDFSSSSTAVEFVVGADENGSIPTFQVKWVFLFPSCHLSSSLRKGTLLKGV